VLGVLYFNLDDEFKDVLGFIEADLYNWGPSLKIWESTRRVSELDYNLVEAMIRLYG
jgi:hypothetical protein